MLSQSAGALHRHPIATRCGSDQPDLPGHAPAPARDRARLAQRVTFRTFRKTVATLLDEAGLTARQIADVLGHAHPSMTQDVYMGRGAVSRSAGQRPTRWTPNWPFQARKCYQFATNDQLWDAGTRADLRVL